MTYAKVLNGGVIDFPYTWEILKTENPHSTFDDRFSLPEWYAQTQNCTETGSSIVEVSTLAMPVVDVALFNMEPPSTPELVDGSWVLRWKVIDKTAEEKAAFAAVQAAIAAAGPAGGYNP